MSSLISFYLGVTLIQFLGGLFLTLMALWELGDTNKASPSYQDVYGFTIMTLISPLWPLELLLLGLAIIAGFFTEIMPRMLRGISRAIRHTLGFERERIKGS